MGAQVLSGRGARWTLAAVASVVLLGLLAGCGGSATPAEPGSSNPPPSAPGTTATLPVNWSPSTSSLPAPPAVEPPPPPQTAFPLTVSSPAGGATVTSPARVVATSAPQEPILYTRIYVDGQAVFCDFFKAVDALIWMSPGAHTLEVLAVDKKGNYSAVVLPVTVASAPLSMVSQIQNLPGWESCSAVFPPESARAGQLCAAGLGTAISTLSPNQATPSLSGKSAKFTLSGPTGYSNMLWFKLVGGSNSATHFLYDLWFLIDNPTASQALEFDLNQTFGGRRWTWGTECNFNDSKKWDIWDPGAQKWVPTSIDCNPFPANQWVHLVWDFERVGEQTRYNSVTINDVKFPLNISYGTQPNWTWDEIDVAFQMDGNFRQEPYNVWLDKVTLQVF